MFCILCICACLPPSISLQRSCHDDEGRILCKNAAKQCQTSVSSNPRRIGCANYYSYALISRRWTWRALFLGGWWDPSAAEGGCHSCGRPPVVRGDPGLPPPLARPAAVSSARSLSGEALPFPSQAAAGPIGPAVICTDASALGAMSTVCGPCTERQ